ncbi:cache domain-containing protein [bacterium]|nr:cache domain-containing protein [bacterium]
MPSESPSEVAAQQRAAASARRLLAVAAAVVALAVFGLAEIGARRADAVAARAAALHLDAVRAAAQAAALATWARLEDGVRRLAADEATARALLELAQASRVSESDPRIDAGALAPQRAALAAHLAQWYAPLGERRPPFDDAIGLPAMRRAQWLQAQYVAGAGLATDGAFADAHARWHPGLAATAAEQGVADLMLVRASDGLVVYDVAKTPVFQTSLLDGAFSDSRLGALYRRSRGAARGSLLRADFAPFAAARGQALAFLAAPVMVDGEPIGSVIAAVDAGALDRALSAGGAWDALGLGASGDVVLVGPDGGPRSTPRRGADAERPLAPALLSGDEGGALPYEVDGRPMLASVGAPGFGELGWRVVATRAADDAQRDAAAARRTLFAAAAGIAGLVIAALAGLVWWGSLPLRHLAGSLARLRLNDPRARVPVLGGGEAAAIALQVNGLVEQHRSERAASRQQHERDARALAEAVDGWQPGEPPPRLPAAGALAPIGTALARLADRLDDARRVARLVPPPAAEALRAAAERLRRDVERNLDALGAAEEATRHAGRRLEQARALAADVATGNAHVERAVRAEQASVRELAAELARADAAAGAQRAVGHRALAALGSGAAAAAALVDELSVLAVNAALQSAPAADDVLAESARMAVERAERVGTELDGTLTTARAALDASATDAAAPAASLAGVAHDLEALVGLLEQARQGVGALGAALRTSADGGVEAAVQAAVDSARRLRQTAELVASEAAAVAGSAAAAAEA